jgi:thiol-disulfide isomerase/thioredoxin
MRRTAIVVLFTLVVCSSASAANLVTIVKMKIAAGDVASGIAAAEDYKRDTGVDAEYLNAVGWIARGAQMLQKPDVADRYVAELHQQIPEEKDGLIVPFGAAIEVEGRLILARQGRGMALRYFKAALARAKDPALRSRINKNINMLTMEGGSAPPIDMSDYVGAAPTGGTKGKVVLLFLWAQGCGDCKAQSVSLARVWQRYRGKDLVLIAPTRFYGTVDEKPATPAEEKERIAKVWGETYAGLDGVTAPIDTAGHIAYGASATPTFVLIDRTGMVRLYAPTRLSEEELSRRVEELLSEPTT